MAVLKNKMESHFSQVPNEATMDSDLSDRAYRILSYLYTRPTNWKIKNKVIMKVFKIKSNKTMATYWKELLHSGWVERKPSRREDGTIKPGYDYVLHISKQVVGDVKEPSPVKKEKIKVDTQEALFEVSEEIEVSEEDRTFFDFVQKYNQKIVEESPHLLSTEDINARYTKRCINVVRLIVTKDGIPLEELETLLNWARSSSFWSSLVSRLTTLRKKGKSEIPKVGTIKSQYDAENSASTNRRKRKSDPLLSKDDVTKQYLKDLSTYGKKKADRLRKKRVEKRSKDGSK